MHLSWFDVDIDAVDRAHAKETEHNTTQRNPGFSTCLSKQGRRQPDLGDDGPVELQRTTVSKVEQRRNAARRCEHDHKQQDGIEKRRPGREWSRKLWQQGQNDGAKQWTKDRSPSAEQDRD